MRHPHIYITLICCMLTSISCKKEVDQFIPLLEPISFDFSGEFTNSSDTLIYKIDGTTRRTIATSKGTEFIVKGSMFEYVNGDFCSCEQIVIEIIELDQKRDYVVHQKPTISNNNLLISAGAYHFAAFHEGKPLKMIQDEQLYLILPSSKLDPGMELFYGEEIGTVFNWTPADAIPDSRAFVTPGEWQTDSSFIIGYECFSDRLGWINIDKLASEGTNNPICVKLDEFYTDQNTVMFAVLVKEKSILNLYFNDEKQGFCLSNIPKGLDVLFIGVHKKGEDLYELASEQTIITADHFQSLSFQVTSFSNIKSFLNSL